MLGPLLALSAAMTFAFNNVSARRGMVIGTASQAMAITVPFGAVLLFVAAAVSGLLPLFGAFEVTDYILLAVAGVLHMNFGRYCNYRSVKAIGAVLSGPVQEMSIIWTVGLAIILLGETVTLQQIAGIALIMFAPSLTMRRSKDKAVQQLDFEPKYAEGYLFATLSALSYGTSPLLIAAAMPENTGLGGGLVSSLISYIAAAVAVMFLVLPFKGQRQHIRSMDPVALKWFSISGVLVCISQMTRYMALAIAPVSVVTPIQRLSVLFRLILSRILNPRLEIFDPQVYVATVLSLFGVFLLTIEAGMLADMLSLPDAIAAFLAFDPLSGL